MESTVLVLEIRVCSELRNSRGGDGVGIIKNFSLVVVSLIADLWFGIVRKPEFYDNHTVTTTKRGYALFVTLAGIIAVGTAIWLCYRIY
jgi:hypothetical protein